jgi:uncharacterized membrane protein affecting hemolysin expression
MVWNGMRPFSVMLLSFRVVPVCVPICLCLVALAVYSSCWVAPSDFQQGKMLALCRFMYRQLGQVC